MDGLLSDPLSAEAWTAEVAMTETLPFEAFYRDERDRLTRALALTLGDGHLAAEAVDEAMVRAYQR